VWQNDFYPFGLLRNQSSKPNPKHREIDLEGLERLLASQTRKLEFLRHMFQSLPFFGLVLFIFLVAYPPFEVATETNLAIHMLQHVLIAVSGVFISYPLYRARKFDSIKSTKSGLLGFVSLSAIVVFWHFPLTWDAAVLNPLIHVLEHFCFLSVGLMIGIFIPMLPDNFKMLVFALALSAHMFYGFALYLTPTAIYPVYPASQQAILGLWLFAPSPAYFIGFLYFTLTRESKRLDADLMAQRGLPSKNTASNVFHLFTALATVMMIVLLIGYFAVTGSTIYAFHSQAPGDSIVYIAESPVTWQYSPQNVVVVIGVNNTVIWVSHSYTIDTVTGGPRNGTVTFDSGPINPGQTWSHTFSSPGIYDYHCDYHPWMKGTVTVVAKS
jgi:plastocyanin